MLRLCLKISEILITIIGLLEQFLVYLETQQCIIVVSSDYDLKWEWRRKILFMQLT